MEEPEVVVEITITWWCLLAIAVAVLAVALAAYTLMGLEPRALLGRPLVEVEFDRDLYKPGELVSIRVRPAGEVGGDSLTLVVADPEGRPIHVVVVRARGECVSVGFLLPDSAPSGSYTVIVKAGETTLATVSFRVSG